MEPFRNWGCNFCGAHGPCSSDEEGWRLAQEHARGCAGYLRNERDTDVCTAAPEMLELLRDLEWNGDRPSAVLLCPECQGYEESQFPGLGGHEKYCKLAALLARFPR